MPSDIDPQSGFRLPLPRREDLDEAGRNAYDRATAPGATIAGLQGPAGVQLLSPRIAGHMAAINRYLRFEAGFTPRLNCASTAWIWSARLLPSKRSSVGVRGSSPSGRKPLSPAVSTP